MTILGHFSLSGSHHVCPSKESCPAKKENKEKNKYKKLCRVSKGKKGFLSNNSIEIKVRLFILLNT